MTAPDVQERFNEQRDRAEALVEATAADPLAIAKTLHHLSMLSREMNKTILDLGSRAADLRVDYEARRAHLIDQAQEKGANLTRARDRATYEAREDRRAAEQAELLVDYAKRTQASVNRRHYELMNVGKTVEREVGGRRG
ncbi:hypothetical protein A9Z40_02985 [Microbacterium arborescens]|uniref:Flagellar FliJ protein n=1 Tax=Microbacterium arborescens TaxID=33883 RepID=A0ABX2WI73_9MICO|nr:hypothetical protein [Microbacterium arborescens]OAZ40921.1 hypothetical protein A9Z40_02985 [Microbacterium arborescens]